MKIFLCGDVMTGRGIDQILPVPGDPVLYEPYVRSALDYVSLAERASGPLPRKVPPGYIWGDWPAAMEKRRVALRIVNLETAITSRGKPEPKGINYRMSPANIAAISSAGIDCCVLANNHVGDWGVEGMLDTLDALHGEGIATAGAGRDLQEAERPAILEMPGEGRVLVYSFAVSSSGVPEGWAALAGRCGIGLLPDLESGTVDRVAASVSDFREKADLVVVSIHWGPNWGDEIEAGHRAFAHALMDRAGVHIVHGHSSHHPKAIEVYSGQPVFYGCGDFINDYEGIAGHEHYRPDLVLGYCLTLDDRSRRLRELELLPFRLRKFRLAGTSAEETAWLRGRMGERVAPYGHSVDITADGTLKLLW